MEIILTLGGKKYPVQGSDLGAKLKAVKDLGLEGTTWAFAGTTDELVQILGSVEVGGTSGSGKGRKHYTDEQKKDLVQKYQLKLTENGGVKSRAAKDLGHQTAQLLETWAKESKRKK